MAVSPDLMCSAFPATCASPFDCAACSRSNACINGYCQSSKGGYCDGTTTPCFTGDGSYCGPDHVCH